jgi:dynein heavy chain 1, cytosolic
VVTKIRDIPALSGSIIWAKGIERQLGEYMKKVENVLGKGWNLYAQGQQLEREDVAFRKQLDTKSMFQQWVREETLRKPVGGKIFVIKRNKLRGNQLELEINFDPKSIAVFKDVRNLIWLGFSVPIQIQNIAKDSKRVYPFAVSLDETLRIYRKTLVRVDQNPQISILVANYHAAIQTLIAKGTQLRWEYFTGISVTENRQAAFVRDLATAVTTFQEKTFSALQYCQAIDVSVGQLSTINYDQKLFAGCLDSIQANVDKLNFESLANLEQWNLGLDARIERALLERLTVAIQVFILLI